MSIPGGFLKKALLENALNWFIPHLNQRLIHPLQSQFPNYPLPREIEGPQRRTERSLQAVRARAENEIDLVRLVQDDLSDDPDCRRLFKQIMLLYRRDRAGYTERLLAKTFDPEMTAAIRQEIDELDSAANHEWFRNIEDWRIPRLKEVLPLQLAEQSAGQTALPLRAYDEKFRILYAPTLFLQDLAYFRAKCEARDVPVAVAFVDIDHFKILNEKYDETFIDRNLLPRFMQTIEGHVYHHGYAYRQGGDEYLILLPSLSKPLAIAFLDELRRKLAALEYPGIGEKSTVSIGLCIAEPDCPLTDRELLDRANKAKKEAKKTRNCIVTYKGPALIPEELKVVAAEQV